MYPSQLFLDDFREQWSAIDYCMRSASGQPLVLAINYPLHEEKREDWGQGLKIGNEGRNETRVVGCISHLVCQLERYWTMHRARYVCIRNTYKAEKGVVSPGSILVFAYTQLYTYIYVHAFCLFLFFPASVFFHDCYHAESIGMMCALEMAVATRKAIECTRE